MILNSLIHCKEVGLLLITIVTLNRYAGPASRRDKSNFYCNAGGMPGVSYRLWLLVEAFADNNMYCRPQCSLPVMM